MTAAITQLLPYPASARLGAEPSRNQPAARTLLPAVAGRRVIDRDRDRLSGRDQQRHTMGRRLPGLPRDAGPGRAGFRAVYPCPHRSTRDNHTLLVTFASLHGAELAADRLTAAGEPASLAAERKAHLADPATITLYRLPCQARARKPAPA